MLSLLTGDISPLVSHCMRSNEWTPFNRYLGDFEKNGHQKSSFVPIYLLLQLSTALALPVFCTNLRVAPSSDLHVNLSLRLCLSLHLVPHSLFLSPTVLSPTGSHLHTTDTLINPGFVLLQKGVGCPSGFTLIALREQGMGIFRHLTSHYWFGSLRCIAKSYYRCILISITYFKTGIESSLLYVLDDLCCD